MVKKQAAGKQPAGKPSEAELQILGVLWDHGSLSVKDVMEKMPNVLGFRLPKTGNYRHIGLKNNRYVSLRKIKRCVCAAP